MRTNVPELRSAVNGFLTPTYVDKDASGRMLNAFSDPLDIKRIAAGYACGNCCATFRSFQLTCPVCGLATNVSGQIGDTPDLWNEHFDEHLNGSGKTETRTPDEFLAAVSADKDIDQVPLRKLKRSRKPRLL